MDTVPEVLLQGASSTIRGIDEEVRSGTREEISLDFLSPSPDPQLLGTFGPYGVTQVVGRGGMGLVLKGHDPTLNRFVAIKVLAPSLAGRVTGRRRFLREAQAATLPVQNSNSGHTWIEGNMTWTRYNHLLTPGQPSCKNDLTWNGVAMTANSRHAGGVHVLLADGGIRFVDQSVDSAVWQALGSIAGGETIKDDNL